MPEGILTVFNEWYLPFLIQGWELFWSLFYIWLPLLFLYLLWTSWLNYVRAKFVHEQERVLLEIKLPREVTRTPKAMEMILSVLNQKGEPESFRHAFWQGKQSNWLSLELVSAGGFIHFYVWVPQKIKNLTENLFYSQYPNVEVLEVEDYAKSLPADQNRYSMWGCHFKLKKKDVYPIRTYVDYGLDKAMKEEEKDDPLTGLLEYLGGLKSGHNVWIQILIKAHRKQGVKDGRLFPKPDWTKQAKEEISKIRDEYAVNKAEGKYMPIAESDLETIKAIRRNQSKPPFDCAIRAMYFAAPDEFDPTNISGLLGNMQLFNSNEANSLGLTWKTDFDHPWKDFRGRRMAKNKRDLVDAYKRRSFFYPPHKNFRLLKPFILSSEELATIFHLPGMVALTPTLPRVGSRKGEAPANLPTE